MAKSKYADMEINDCTALCAAAQDELVREFQVRKRCFDRWVQDGRLSDTDAYDRMNRLGASVRYLRMLSHEQRQKELPPRDGVTSTGDKTGEGPF